MFFTCAVCRAIGRRRPVWVVEEIFGVGDAQVASIVNLKQFWYPEFYMKRFLSSLAGLAMLAGVIGPTAASAQVTLQAGDLIKGPGDAVYYYAGNAKRYVFPTSATYFTWYSDFSSVKTLSASELAEIAIGGNVTYRPGVKLVKVTTDPKVYAVSAHGVLRWVSSESAALSLYGANWNKNIDDVPDTFFTNYTVGILIVNGSDFQPAAQRDAAVTIDVEKQVTVANPVPTPSPTPTPTATSTTATLTFTASKSQIQGGDVISVTATSQDTGGVARFDLFFDGSLFKSCVATTVCSGEKLIPLSGTKTAYDFVATVKSVSGVVQSKSLTLPVLKDGASMVRVTLSPAQILPSQNTTVQVEADISLAVLRIDIMVGPTIVKGCVDGSRICNWSEHIDGAALGKSYAVSAVVTDTLGRTYTSKVSTLTIGTNDTPSVTVTPAKTSIFAGEKVDVTVSASDLDGIASIDVMQDGVSLKHCDGAVPCTVSTGPWNVAGADLQFSGQATDAKGGIGSNQAMKVVHVNSL